MSIGLLTSLFIFSMTLFCSVLLLTSWMSFIKGANNRDKNNTSDNFKILSQYGFKSKEMKYNKLHPQSSHDIIDVDYEIIDETPCRGGYLNVTKNQRRLNE